MGYSIIIIIIFARWVSGINLVRQPTFPMIDPRAEVSDETPLLVCIKYIEIENIYDIYGEMNSTLILLKRCGLKNIE